MLLSGTYASMPRSSITSRLCREKKPLSALTCPGGGATLALHPVCHRHQQPVVVQLPADLLGHDQMIVAHCQRRGVAERESPAIRQKAAVCVGARKLPHSGLLQPLQPHGNLPKLSFELLHRRARHLQPSSFIGIFTRALLLPPPNVLADLGSFRSQLFQGLCGASCRVRRNARGIDGYVSQLPQTQRARQLYHLREDVVHRSTMPLAKFIQRPKIWLRPSRQIAKRQIFSDALLQPSRTGHPQRVGIQPHLQQQRRMIGQMPFSQHFPHGWWQQIGLLRVVLQKIGHPALLLSRQYRGSVKPSCHTDSYTPVVTGSMRNRLRPQGIQATRGAYDGGGERGRRQRSSQGGM